MDLMTRDLADMTEDELRSGLSGSTAVDERSRLLRELMRRGDEGTLELARSMLRSPGDPVELRSIAAVELAQRATEENEGALLAGLRSDDPQLVRRAAVGLGKIGGERALAVLRGARSEVSASNSKVLDFALSLISYRLGLDEARLAPPPGGSFAQVSSDEATVLDLVEVPEDELEASRRDLEGELPAIAVSSSGSLRIDCLGERHWIVLTEAAERGREWLAGHPAVIAAVLKSSSCTEKWYLSEYILSHPGRGSDGQGLEVFGVRTTGRMAHHGEIALSRDGGLLSLRSLDTAGVPALELQIRFPNELRHPEVHTARRSPARASSDPIAVQA